MLKIIRKSCNELIFLIFTNQDSYCFRRFNKCISNYYYYDMNFLNEILGMSENSQDLFFS